jgi:hypothetical protein
MMTDARAGLVGAALMAAAFGAWTTGALADEAPAGDLAGITDLPLAPGRVEIADAGTSFDTGQGRIVEAHALGSGNAAAVRAFYDETLPQLGWSPAGALVWRREGEALTLDLRQPRPGQVAVRFSLVPQR